MRPETPQNRSQYHRLRRIIAMVREGMAGGRLPNRSDFRRELEVSPRTLARDLDFLRDEERAPIAYEPARHGYRLTDATYDLPPVNLSRREVFSFSLARKMLHSFEGTPLEMDMRSTLDKIAGSLEGTFAVSLDALTEHMSVQAEDRVVIDPAVCELGVSVHFLSLVLISSKKLSFFILKACFCKIHRCKKEKMHTDPQFTWKKMHTLAFLCRGHYVQILDAM